MTFLTLALRAPLSIEHMPADPGVVSPGPLTIAWSGKQTHYTLPYDVDDLVVAPGQPDPVIVNPPTGPGVPTPGTGGGTTLPSAPPSGTVRPATPPRLLVQARVAPANFRSKGIRVRVMLPERAKLEVYATARVKKRLSRRRTATTVRTVTRKRTLTRGQGMTVLRLSSSAAGRAAVGSRSRVRATVTLKARFSDGRVATVTRTVLIARSTKS